jgi:predicted RNA-binding Zn-ribbon protein involved in translation (DUF1610 family)
MPELLQGEHAVAISQEEIDRRRSAVGNGSETPLYWNPGEAKDGTMAVWDMVDGTRTTIPTTIFSSGPFKGRIAALEKVVSKCSACTYTVAKGEHDSQHVLSHIENVQQQTKDHEHAEARELDKGFSCSACGTQFISRPMNVHRHIQQMKDGGPAHLGAVEVVMKRFSLQLPVQPVVVIPMAPAVGLESETSQMERSQGHRRRRRRNRHKQKAGA